MGEMLHFCMVQATGNKVKLKMYINNMGSMKMYGDIRSHNNKIMHMYKMYRKLGILETSLIKM